MENFTKNKLAVALIIVLALLNFLSVSFILFSPMGSGFMKGRDQVQSFIEDELKFSDVQKKQYDELREQHFARGDSMAVIQATALNALFTLMKSETVDTNAVRRNAEILGSIETARSIGLFEHFRAVRSLCTPDQQKKFDAVIFEVLNRVRDPHGPPKPRNK